jgi:Arc/MetJ-type ribon-helix-helix transcriptional regulator
MAHALTRHYEEVIDRLIQLGIFANRSEAVRAGLKELENKYLSSGYLGPQPLREGTLAEIYRKIGTSEDAEESRAMKMSRRRKPQFDE